MMHKFHQHVDSLDISNDKVIVGLSSLEGNIWDGNIKVLSLDTLDEVDSYHVPSGVSIIRFADLSCKLFLAGCDNGDLISGYSCDLSMSCKVAVRQAHDSTISSIDMNTFSSEDQSIFTSGWEGDIKIWDLSHLETSPLIKLSRAHYGHINSISILKSKSHAASLISVGDDGFARLWDPRAVNRNCCGIVNLHQRGNACLWDSMDPLCFHVGTEDGSLLLFDTRKLGDSFESGGQDAILSKISVHSARVRQLRQYEGSSMLFSCSDDFTVASLDIQKIKALGVDTPGVPKISRLATGHDDYVTDIAYIFHNGKKWLLSASTDKTIRKTLLE